MEPEPEPQPDSGGEAVKRMLSHVKHQQETLSMLQQAGLSAGELQVLAADIAEAERQVQLAIEAEIEQEARVAAAQAREATAATAVRSAEARRGGGSLVQTRSAQRLVRPANGLARMGSAPTRTILDTVAVSNPKFEEFDFDAAYEWERYLPKPGSRDAGKGHFWHNKRTKETTWVGAPMPGPVAALEGYKRRHPRVEDVLEDMPVQMAQELLGVGVIRDDKERRILYSKDSHPIDALIEASHAHSLRFCDPAFPTSASSLGSDQWRVHAWRRPSDLHHTPALFSTHMGATSSEITDSIEQGSLGDCWLLSAIASVSAGDEERVKELFYPCRYNPYGCYAVRIWVDGSERWVVVDDQIPCSEQGRPVFSHSRDGREVWVLLLEKAFAKLQGSYRAIDAGLSKVTSDSALIMSSMTGGISASTCRRCKAQLQPDASRRRGSDRADRTWWVANQGNAPSGPHTKAEIDEYISDGVVYRERQLCNTSVDKDAWTEAYRWPDFKDHPSLAAEGSSDEINDLFDTASTILKSGFGGGAIVLSCTSENRAQKESLGLVPHHAYSVLDAGGGRDKEWSGGLSFLRLRNPWGEREWTGPWSDSDSQWESHPEIDRRLRRERGYADTGADGAFWMELSDVRRNFDVRCVSWCWFSEFLYREALVGAWDEHSAGGQASNETTWARNPHFEFVVDQRGLFLIKVSNTDRRFADDPTEASHIGFELLRGSGSADKLDYPLSVPKSARVTKRTKFFWGALEPGTYWIVPDAWDPGIIGGFVLQVASPSVFRLQARQKTDFLRTLTANWVANRPCRSPNALSEWPPVVLSTKQRCWIKATMQCENVDHRGKELSVQLHVCRSGGSRTTDALASSRYLLHHSATVELVLSAAGRYNIFAMAVEHGGSGRGDYNGGGVRIRVTVECTDLGSSLKGNE